MTTRDDRRGERAIPADGAVDPETDTERANTDAPTEQLGAVAEPKPGNTPEPPDVTGAPEMEGASASDVDDDEAPAPRAEPAPTVPRKNTLAVAIPKRNLTTNDFSHTTSDEPATAVEHDEPTLVVASSGRPPFPGERPPAPDAAEIPDAVDVADDVEDDIEDEVEEDDEWSIADQPTIYLTPRRQQPVVRETPPIAEPDEKPVVRRTLAHPGGAARPPLTSRPAGSRGAQPVSGPHRERLPSTPNGNGRPRLGSPSGRLAQPAPPEGVSPAALPDPRLQRFQRLRERRLAHDAGGLATDDPRPVADVARQWWNDLLPGTRNALRHQHEARASGVHPIPAYEPAPSSRLGDAFGRLAASARELGGRAQSVAGPALKRIHTQAEQAAQAIVQRIEGPAARQQAPLLGPGRIAVFFHQGVTVREAHETLTAAHARPLRLIPRKHGFLAYVAPGSEVRIAAILHEDPNVADVAYLEYDNFGNPVE